MSNVFIIFLDFFLYAIAMFLLGFYAMTKAKGNEEFILGGRSIGPYTSAISAGASDMSSWLILGLPGAVFAGGLVEGLWISLGLIIGAYLNWHLVAAKLREYSEKLNALTIPSFLQNRFNSKGTAIKTIATIVILVFFTLYVASALKAGSLLFSFIFELATLGGNYINADSAAFIGLVTTTFVVVSYTFLGGYLAICWTDLVQGLIMLAALAFIVIFGYHAINSSNIDIATVKPDAFNIATGWVTAASLMAWGLGYFGQPHILARFLGIRSEKDVPLARKISISWMVVCLILSVSVGLIGIGYAEIKELAGVTGEGGNKERIFLVLTYTLFHPFVAGLILAAVLAALMSTADSQLLVLSSSLTEDLSFFAKMEEKQKMMVSRIGIVAFALVAFVLANNDGSSILAMVGYAWGGFGAAFGPLIILSVCWKGITQAGAIAGMVTGALSIVIFKNFVSVEGQYFYELLPSFFIALAVIVLVSMFTPKPDAETTKALGLN